MTLSDVYKYCRDNILEAEHLRQEALRRNDDPNYYLHDGRVSALSSLITDLRLTEEVEQYESSINEEARAY